MHTLLFTPRGLGLLVVGTLVGGVLAALRLRHVGRRGAAADGAQVDAVTAARASLAAVLAIRSRWRCGRL